MNKNIHKSNRKIMLIEPPFYRLYHDQFCLVKYPLALGYLSGSIIKNTNWSVQTYNADFNVNKKSIDPSGEYLSGKGFKRYLLTLKESEKLYPGLKDMPKEKPTGDYSPNFGQTGENHPSWIDGRFSLDKVGYMKEWREKNKDKITPGLHGES